MISSFGMLKIKDFILQGNKISNIKNSKIQQRDIILVQLNSTQLTIKKPDTEILYNSWHFICQK